jgi:hypothetical protein
MSDQENERGCFYKKSIHMTKFNVIINSNQQ